MPRTSSALVAQMKIHVPKSDFSSFTLSSAIMTAVEKAGYKYATDVQTKTIPAVLEGKDVLARAETGSGKTAAFVLPLLEQLTNLSIYRRKDTHSRYDGSKRAASNCVQILVLVPTRELAIQVRGVFEQMSENIEPEITCQSVFGGVKINPQMMALRSGTDVLVATPGRLLDLVDQNAIKFNQIKTVVIDEVDRLMKGDFAEEIDRILKLLPNKRQNLMFTATFPESIRTLVREVMNDPAIINVDDNPEDMPITQRVITVNHDKKNDLLAHLLNENDWKQVLIFCSAKRTCNNLVVKLEKRGIEAIPMHGDKEQSARTAALRGFKSGTTRILVATDVAARGIDIEQLPCVINYDLPRSPNDYVHRIGRTGRAGQAGMAISLISHHEYQHFEVIDKRNDLQLEPEQIEGFEADAIAPPPPERTHPKKLKNRKKLSKKKRKVQKELSEENSLEDSNPDQVSDEEKLETKPKEKVSEETSQESPEKAPEKKDPAVNSHIWGSR